MIPANTTRTWLFRAVLVFVSYFLTGLAGLSVPFIETHITLIWAPTGIALAALLRWGGSLWPAIWLGAMGVNLWIGSPLLLAAAIACGNTLGPVLAAWLLRRKGFDQRLHNRRDLQLYLSVGVIGGMTISASNGVLQLWLTGVLSADNLLAAWSVWWLGDAMGALVCGVPLLTASRQSLDVFGNQRRRELLLVLSLLVTAGALIFNGPVSQSALYHPILYLPFFLLSCLAVRGSIALASGAALLLAIEAVWATSQGTGPFQSNEVHFSLAMLWGYMATATIIPVLITVLMDELRQSQHRLALATLGAELGMWEWNLETDAITHADESCLPLSLAQTHDGNTLRSVMHSDDVEVLDVALLQHLSGGADMLELECRFYSGPGRWCWMLMRGRAVESDSRGTPLKMAGTLVDIDARKQAEAELQTSRIKLQQSEERYRQLLNNSPVGIINYDRNLVVSYVNERFADIMKVPVDYMLGLDCTGLKDQRVVPALEQALEGKNALYEGEYCTSYGQEKIWISMRCAPVRGECGEVLGGVALLEDITARKDAEQNLRKFKFFSDNAADMLMLTDETTRICYANRATCEALGYRQDELLNMKVPDIDPRNSEKEVRAIIDQCKEQWTPPFETVHRRRDGTEFSVEITARAMPFNGEWLCFTSARDITDRKLLDDRERRHREGLKALNEVAAQSHLPLKQQMRKALQIGARYYDLDCAIISAVSGSDYRVHVFSAPPGALEEDQHFALGETYCDLTLKSRDVVAISHMEVSPYSGHPCYRKFQLESYLGAPVWVDNSLYGTVNFSSAKPYPRAFDAGDREFIRLLARWIGSVMTLDKSRAALVASEAYLKAIIETEPECVKVMSQDGQVTQMNRAGLEMLEVESVEEINQKGVLNFVDKPYRQAFETLHQQAFSGQHGSLEFTVTGKHGHMRWLDTHAAPLKNEEGRVTSVLSVTRDISLLKQQQLELKDMAHFDALTRLPNRTLLSERMSRAVVLARRHQTEFAVCYLDLDGFKPINDELGHDAGDQVLIEIGNRLTGALREVDTVSRLGGDEFVLLMSDLSHHEDWQSALSRVLMEVTRPLPVKGQERSVSASIGVAFYPQDGEDPETLLRHADHAMYAAKRAGKNRYNLFSTEDGCVTRAQKVH